MQYFPEDFAHLNHILTVSAVNAQTCLNCYNFLHTDSFHYCPFFLNSSVHKKRDGAADEQDHCHSYGKRQHRNGKRNAPVIN